jgi:hypothetical protein
VIVYEESPPRDTDAPPDWLEGAADLQRREGPGKRWWGIGSGALVGPQDGAKWSSVGPGITAILLRGFDPLTLAKQQSWCPTTCVSDLKGRLWRAPCLLNDKGERQFFVEYGDNFEPALSDEQANAERIALAVRSAINAANATTDTEKLGLPTAMACRAAAVALALVNHIPFEAFAPFRFLDDALTAGVLFAMSGKTPRLGGGNG